MTETGLPEEPVQHRLTFTGQPDGFALCLRCGRRLDADAWASTPCEPTATLQDAWALLATVAAGLTVSILVLLAAG